MKKDDKTYENDRELLKKKLRKQVISNDDVDNKDISNKDVDNADNTEEKSNSEDTKTEKDEVKEKTSDKEKNSDKETENKGAVDKKKSDEEVLSKKNLENEKKVVIRQRSRAYYEPESSDLTTTSPSRMAIWITVATMAFVLIFAYFMFNNYAKFTEYRVVWSRDLPQGSFVGYEKFGGSLMKYSKDAVTYLDKDGRSIWTDGFEMENPFATSNGDYLAIADKQKNKICIYNNSGKTGVVETVNPITRLTISKKGVVATVEEDNVSSYINYYNKDGTKLGITIRTKMSGNGYPTDLSISPDGSTLMVSFEYIENASLRCKVVFYDFSGNTEDSKKAIAGFNEPFDNSFVAKVGYINQVNSFAGASSGIYIFSLRNPMSPELVKEIKSEQEIENIAYSDKYIALVSKLQGYASQIEVYKNTGSLVFKKKTDKIYKYFDIDGDYFFLYNNNECAIYNSLGVEKFSGTFDFEISKITKGKDNNSFIITGPSFMKSIKLY